MIYDIFERVKKEKPLIHHITNWVTIYDCANMTRSFGALPVMAHAVEESADMAGIASALVLNIGTLTPQLVSSMICAGIKANERLIPVVLDAVGVGATKLRDEKALEILEKVKITILKGNSSEIARLAGKDVITRGVESSKVDADMITIAKELAAAQGLCVVVTGKEDIVSDGSSVYVISNGHAMMGSVVGTGCMAASVIGSFAAVENDSALASAAALVCYGIAGELAAVNSNGPGSFKSNFYDEVYNLDRTKIERMQKIEKR
ncbi:MAG: hydroxyethylthiazole kinase [Candidatus Latescibacterota bacterium]